MAKSTIVLATKVSMYISNKASSPPITLSAMDSTKNWIRMKACLAPSDY